MKKLVLSLFILGASALGSFAQTSPIKGQFSLGIEAGLPVGDASNGYTFGIGGSLKYDHPVADNLFVTGSAGYTKFFFTDEAKALFRNFGFAETPNIGFIPVKAGLKYFFSPGFFGEAQLGAAFAIEDGSGTSFVYAPGIGYAFSEKVEAGIRYEGWSRDGSTLEYFGLRVAYKF